MKKMTIVLLSCLISTAASTAAENTASVRMRVLAERVQTAKTLAAARETLAPYRDEIVSAARGTDSDSRVMAVYLLGLAAPDADVLRALVSASRDGDPRLQETALAGLAANRSNVESAEVREALLAPIVDKSSARAYRAASFGAAFVGFTEAVPVIAADLRSTDVQIRQAALQALREYGPAAQSALPALQEQLHAARDQETATALREVIRRVEKTQ